MPLIEHLESAIEPLVPGLVTAGVFIISLLVLRVSFRRDGRITEKLRLPSSLLTLYLLIFVLVVAARLYWKPAYSALHLVSLFVLSLAVVLATAFGIFDIFLGRYRQVQMPTILRDIVVVMVYLIVIFVVLGRHGVDLTSILTTSAVLTAIVGFALQDLLSNIISGLALQIERPFKVGDWVKFSDQQGKVLEMNWRSTKIFTLHNDIVVIPNNVITRGALINFTAPSPIHRRKLDIGLRYEAAPNRAKRSILKALADVDGVLADPAPYVLLKEYGDFAIGYRVHFYTAQFPRKERIEDQVYTRIWYQLKRDGLSIPFPIRDINVRQVSDEDQQRSREQELEQIIAALRKVPFLEPLEDADQKRLARRIKREYFARNEVIIRQGDEGDSFYVIAEGEVEVRVGEQRVAKLTTDDFFGEMSLMTGERRSATIVTLRDSELYMIDKRSFQLIIEGNEALVDAIGRKLEQRRSSLAAKREEIDDHAADDHHADTATLVDRIRRFFNLR